MVKNFITELTKVTDFFIIVATVFVFLAFITPAEKSMQPLIDQNESELSSILNDRSQLISILESYRQQEASLKNELNTILNAPLEIIEVDEPIVGIELENIDQVLPIDTSLIEADITQTERQINSSTIDLQQLENKISATEQTLKDLILESKSSKSVGWLQPIRKNTMILIDAGGIDGLIAGFTALIFCLVFKRRRGWFRNVFGIRLK